MRHLTKKRRLQILITVAGLIVVLTLLTGEIFARVYFALRPTFGIAPGFIRPDSQLGWVHAPSVEVRETAPDFAVTYRTDAAGHRLTAATERGEPRITFYGDSFTEGLGVEDHETFASALSRLLPRAEVVNAGVRGHSPDQYYLRFLNDCANAAFRPAIAVVGLYPSNDLDDINHPYVRAYIDAGRASAQRGKPHLVATTEGYRFAEVPSVNLPGATPQISWPRRLMNASQLVSLLRDKRDALPGVGWFIGRVHSTARANPEELRLAVARLRWLTEETARTGVNVVYVLIPSRNLLARPTGAGEELDRYHAARELLAAQQAPYLDLLATLPADGKDHLPIDGHFSPVGNERVAAILRDKLRSLGWLDDGDTIAAPQNKR